MRHTIDTPEIDMRFRFISQLVLAASLAIATSGVAIGQDEPSASPIPGQRDNSALESLCAANAEDDAAITTCVEAVQAILTPDGEVTAVEESGVSGRVIAIVDKAVAAADGLDVQPAIDDARASLAELDMPTNTDDAVAAAQDVDVGAMINEAIASAREVDVQEVVDGIVADIEDRDVLGTIEDGIEITRNVVGAAQTWVAENPELVCDAGSAGIGVGAAAVV
ncbi:MAG: hypothetical protein ACC726_11740, partial [Chloroflexota bacterium]